MRVSGIKDIVKKFANRGAARRAGEMLDVKWSYQPAVP